MGLLSVVVTVVLVVLVGMVAPVAAADLVLHWNDELLDAIRAEGTNPPRATRAMAMVNVAVFDSVVGIAGGYQSYAVAGPGPVGASLEAAAAAAAHGVLVHLYPGRQAILDEAFGAHVQALPASLAVTDGLAWGAQVAAEIVALRADDGSDAVASYDYVPGAGWWVTTPPAFAPALLPNWPQVVPWTLSSPSRFRVPSPPPPSSPEYTAAFEEVKRLGSTTSSERTADQAEIARFWNDGPGTNTPPGHWNEILQTLAEQHDLSLIENARLFALHGMVVADAAIVSWENKYYYNHWRPVTGIRLAGEDGNPATEPDEAWTNYIGTPPFPAYTSGHSSFSGSSSRIAELFFGSDAQAFSVVSDGEPGAVRHFTSLSEAAEEAGMSRIYGGIHWQYDNEQGLVSGRRVAEQAFFAYLRPSTGAVTACDPQTQLCLGGGRFAVDVSWRTDEGDTGAGVPVPLNEGSGSFWFFQEGNTEVTVKVIDACTSEFDRYWVFASGLTDVEVVLTVTDTHEGRVRHYFNPRGTAFAPVQDTDAFDTCP
ncbi:MAG TPA: vanadium-dependent haloperoxidase [Thermoanaerobaculia bacterium]|nr:vanadium-dependent haloperoxidase [Thermoanaerobaculia bacterium]